MPRPPIIPRDTLVECRQWELADFERRAELAAAAAVSPPPPSEPEEPPISEEEWQAALDAGLVAARDKGRRGGFVQDFQGGFEQGRRQDGGDSKHIATLMQSAHEAIDQLNGSVAEELVDLALQLMQQFLHGVLHAQPKRILPLIREVLGDAPTASTPAMLHTHTDDTALACQTLGMELVAADQTLIVSAAIKHGDCHAQTHSSEADTTLQTCQAELTRALSRDTAWPVSGRAEAGCIAGGTLHVA